MPYPPRTGLVRQKTVSFRCTDAEIKRLNAAARVEGKTRSDHLRDLALEDLNRKGL